MFKTMLPDIKDCRPISDSMLEELGISKISPTEFFKINTVEDYFALMDGDEAEFQKLEAEGFALNETDPVGEALERNLRLANLMDNTLMSKIKTMFSFEYIGRKVGRITNASPLPLLRDFHKFDQKDKSMEFEQHCYGALVTSKSGEAAEKVFGAALSFARDYIDHLKRLPSAKTVAEAKKNRKNRVNGIFQAMGDANKKFDLRKVSSREMNKKPIEHFTVKYHTTIENSRKEDLRKKKVLELLKENGIKMADEANLEVQKLMSSMKSSNSEEQIAILEKAAIHEIEFIMFQVAYWAFIENIMLCRAIFFKMANTVYLKGE